jgi:hypothetical protein
MVEIPDSTNEFENPGPPELQLKALGTAMNATSEPTSEAPGLPILRLVEFGSAGRQSRRLWSSQFYGEGRLSRMDSRVAFDGKTRRPGCPVGFSLSTGQPNTANPL